MLALAVGAAICCFVSMMLALLRAARLARQRDRTEEKLEALSVPTVCGSARRL